MLLTNLSDRERELITSARRGDWLICSDLDPAELRDSRLPGHLIRGQVLRELLLGRHGELDPRGVRVHRARITGDVDLNHVKAVVGLSLNGCVLDEPAQLEAASLPWIDLDGSHVPAVNAERLHTDGPVLMRDGFTAHANSDLGAIRLLDAHVGTLEITGAQLTNTGGPALNAERLQTDGPVLLRNGFIASATGELGAVCLVDARIGSLEMDSAQLSCTGGPALNAERLHADNWVFLRNGFTAKSNSRVGAVHLLDARIGSLEMDGAQLTDTEGPGINAERLQANGPVLLRDGFSATGSGSLGAICLVGARVGTFEVTNALLTDKDGPALNAERLHTNGPAFLRDGFTAIGSGRLGAVCLIGAHIGGNLEFDNAQLTNPNGPALNAAGLHTDGPMYLRERFTATSNSGLGAICIVGAHIGSSLEMDGAHLTDTEGPGLNAERLHTGGPVLLRSGFTATGRGNLGAVCLVAAHIGDTLEMDSAQLTNADGEALNAESLHTSGPVLLRNGFTASGNSDRGAIRLLNAQINGNLEITGAAHLYNSNRDLLLDIENAHCSTMWMSSDLLCPRGRRSGKVCRDGNRQLEIDGFTYTSFGNISWAQWLHLVRCHTQSYRPMPYQQLAAVRTAAGHDRDARHILITQQHDHRARGDIGGPARRAIHRIWGALAGYGYRTGRTALALFATLALAGMMGYWAGHTSTGQNRYAAEHTATPGPCTVVELIGLGVDRGLPLASTGIRVRCDLNTATPAGQRFTVAIWLLQAIVWALATLALAGYTSLIRRIR